LVAVAAVAEPEAKAPIRAPGSWRPSPGLRLDSPGRRRRAAMWTRFRRNRAAVAGLLVLLGFVVLALGAPLLTSYDPEQTRLEEALHEPSAQHLLGTDQQGRDVFARLAYGGRYSLWIGFAAVGLGLIIGVPLGAVSGYYGGWVDLTIQRVIDVLLSFPGFLLALTLVAVLGVGLENVVVAVGLGVVPAFVRLVRASTLAIRHQPYVDAARSYGASGPLIIWRHVLPNALPPVVVQATLGLGSTLLTAAGLGFLGLGVQAPTPEWGSMLGEGRQYLFNSPNLATFSGIAIFLTVLGFNLIGDGLRDALDPTADR
jgi:ABC-type dipeptide/oligopeptide/nickel transport system permease subunit